MSRTAAQMVERTRNMLAFFLIGAFVGALVSLTFRGVPESNRDILTYMVGQLSGMATMALGFYFTKGAGQDAIDAAKTENTGKLADAVVYAARSGETEQAARAAEQTAQAAVDKSQDFKGTDNV